MKQAQHYKLQNIAAYEARATLKSKAFSILGQGWSRFGTLPRK
jgi:hypothetical protein